MEQNPRSFAAFEQIAATAARLERLVEEESRRGLNLVDIQISPRGLICQKKR